MVSRAAFYAHFQDKLALLDYAMLCKQHELLDLSGEARPRDLMRHMLERIRDDRVFYRELVLNELDWRFLEVLSGSLSQFIERVRRECPTEADVEPSLSSLYCAGGMANLVFWWVRNDFPLSVDELAEAQNALIEGSLGVCLPTDARTCRHG